MALIYVKFKLIECSTIKHIYFSRALRVKANIIFEGGKYYIQDLIMDSISLAAYRPAICEWFHFPIGYIQLVEIGLYERNMKESRFDTAVTLRILRNFSFATPAL